MTQWPSLNIFTCFFIHLFSSSLPFYFSSLLILLTHLSNSPSSLIDSFIPSLSNMEFIHGATLPQHLFVYPFIHLLVPLPIHIMTSYAVVYKPPFLSLSVSLPLLSSNLQTPFSISLFLTFAGLPYILPSSSPSSSLSFMLLFYPLIYFIHHHHHHRHHYIIILPSYFLI